MWSQGTGVRNREVPLCTTINCMSKRYNGKLNHQVDKMINPKYCNRYKPLGDMYLIMSIASQSSDASYVQYNAIVLN